MFSFLLTLFDRLKENNINLTINEKIDILKSILKIDITDKNSFFYAIASNAAHSVIEREKVLHILENLNPVNAQIDTDIRGLSDRFTRDIYAKKEFLNAVLHNRDILELFINNQNIKTAIEDNEVLSRLYEALIYEEKESEFIEFINKLSYDNKELKELIDKLAPNPLMSKKQAGIKETTITRKKIDISDIPFDKIDNDDIKQLRQSIQITARRLIRKIFKTYESGRSHILNVHKTLRKNAAYENIPFRTEFKKRRMKRRDIVILCDMSQSVRNSTFIMLAFMNELTLIFKRVRSFAFVSDVSEITQLVQNRDFNTVVNSLLSGGINNLFGNSNYGLSFYKFYTQYSNILNKNTIVIIFGDGRNNYNDPNLYDLKNIRKKVNKLYWFVPEGRDLWGKGDSQLPLYLTGSDRAFTITTLSQLSSAILKISQY
ncbi:MAG: VWA domain-containing protein [Myxococcota bacterium]